MRTFDIIRAWKDAEYRKSLSHDELSQLPENPAGTIELTEQELGLVAGAATNAMFTAGCCQSIYCTTNCPTYSCGTYSDGCPTTSNWCGPTPL